MALKGVFQVHLKVFLRNTPAQDVALLYTFHVIAGSGPAILKIVDAALGTVANLDVADNRYLLHKYFYHF